MTYQTKKGKRRLTIEMDEVLYQSVKAAINADMEKPSRSAFIRRCISKVLASDGIRALYDDYCKKEVDNGQ